MVNATVVVIIEKGGKILLTKRSAKVGTYKGFWCLPGGSIDMNETASSAAIREAKEETNLDIVPNFLFYWDGICPEENVHYLDLVFYSTAKGKVKINEESTDYKWVTSEEALKMKLAFRHNGVIKKWISDKKQRPQCNKGF